MYSLAIHRHGYETMTKGAGVIGLQSAGKGQLDSTFTSYKQVQVVAFVLSI